jgi:hypothetical protein
MIHFMKPPDDTDRDRLAKENRRKFLKKAGTIVVAAPVMESLSRKGILVRTAHAQTVQFVGFGGPMAGPIGELP